ncbi:hypothetical protein FJZ21_02030 [Candidatus Pacearchaeota archaeon]|nr:hypothetical protein [Candidatus Pacearchaeota archaeon]
MVDAERMTPLEETEFLLKIVGVRVRDFFRNEQIGLATDEVNMASAFGMRSILDRTRYAGASKDDILLIRKRFDDATSSLYAQIEEQKRMQEYESFERAVFG